MFSFEIDPKQLLDLFRKALMNDEMTGAVLRFTPTNVVTSSFAMTYGAYGDYNLSRFKNYKCDAVTDIKISPAFVNNFETIQITSEPLCFVEFNTGDKTLKVTAGPRRRWTPNIPNLEVKTVGFEDSKLILVKKENVGYLPTSKTNRDVPIHFQCKIDASSVDLPKTEKATVVLDNDTMMLKWDLDGAAELDINIDKTKVIIPRILSQPEEKHAYDVMIPYVRQMLSVLKGEVYFTFFEKTWCITQITPEAAITYFISTS